MPQLARFVELNHRTLQSWLEQGVLSPSIQASRGKGMPNLFSRDDAFLARALADLRRAGVGLDRLQDAAGALRRLSGSIRNVDVLVINGEISIRSGTDTLAEALSEPGPGLAYRLGPALMAAGLTSP